VDGDSAEAHEGGGAGVVAAGATAPPTPPPEAEFADLPDWSPQTPNPCKPCSTSLNYKPESVDQQHQWPASEGVIAVRTAMPPSSKVPTPTQVPLIVE
jgi:hypothetical protein